MAFPQFIASFKNGDLINNFPWILNTTRLTNENSFVSVLSMAAPKLQWQKAMRVYKVQQAVCGVLIVVEIVIK